MKTSVYITIDTESSMGGAWQDARRRPLPAARHVFCETADGAYGLPLIVETLSRHNLRATFFCEMLATQVLGVDDTRSITDFLLKADQDVQLHVHPTYRYYAHALRDAAHLPAAHRSDQLSAHPRDEQLAILSEAVDIFQHCTGRTPAAFRAGNFSADQATLSVLYKLGILIDSSFNPVYSSQRSFDTSPPQWNLVQNIEGVWEFPITVARTRLPEGNGLKPFDVGALSSTEMETILTVAHEAGMEHVTLIFHCFSTVKPKDAFYSSLRPNRIVIRRLQWLLRFLTANVSRFEVRTFCELVSDLASLERPQVATVPDLGLWRPAARKAVQALNRFYWT